MKKNEKEINDTSHYDLNWAQAEASLPRLDNPNQEDTTGEGMQPRNDVGGVKPRVSGRQGSMDSRDGGQDTGSSAGSH